MADTPLVTEFEAAILRYMSLSPSLRTTLLVESGLCDEEGITDLGRAALDAYDAQQYDKVYLAALRECKAIVYNQFEHPLCHKLEVYDTIAAIAAKILALIATKESNG